MGRLPNAMTNAFFASALCALLAQGCSLFGSDEEAILSLSFHVPYGAQDQPNFRMVFSDGEHGRTLERGDFDAISDRQYNAGPFDTATSGTLRVSCSVLDGRGRAVATEGLSLPLRPDQRYDAICSAGPHNPYRSCFGCWGFEARSLARAPEFAPGDSLFVVWSRNSISSPVVY